METPPAKNRTTRRRKRGLATLFVGLLLLVALLKGAMFSPLPTGAYPVLSTAEWTGSNISEYKPYRWLPNGDLAYLQADRNGMKQVWYQKMDAHGPIGAPRPGPELSLARWMDTFYPSPDEQWIAYMQYTAPRNYKTFVVSADGKTTFQGGEFFYGWLSDSRSYLCMAVSKKSDITIQHLNTSRSETITSNNEANGSVPITTVPSTPTFLMGSHFYNPGTNPGHPQCYPLMTLRSFSNTSPAVAEQTWQAKVPADMTFGTAYASPDGTRLLWITGKQSTSFWSDIRWRLLPASQKAPIMEAHLFISDLHGDNLRPVFTNALGGTNNYAPVWTPDSKHLSFIYKNQLYLVPVE